MDDHDPSTPPPEIPYCTTEQIMNDELFKEFHEGLVSSGILKGTFIDKDWLFTLLNDLRKRALSGKITNIKTWFNSALRLELMKRSRKNKGDNATEAKDEYIGPPRITDAKMHVYRTARSTFTPTPEDLRAALRYSTKLHAEKIAKDGRDYLTANPPIQLFTWDKFERAKAAGELEPEPDKKQPAAQQAREDELLQSLMEISQQIIDEPDPTDRRILDDDDIPF